jgi:hypothetical protein
MFCPKCAAQNADDAKYCRGCGADISLVPQAVTGQLAERLSEGEDQGRSRRHHRNRRERPVTIERAVKSFFTGVGFIFVALAVSRYMPGGRMWWFWLLIPAFAMMGEGVATYLRLRQNQSRLAPPTFTPAQQAPAVPPGFRGAELPPRNTSEMIPPPSVTENTTRHLKVPARGEREER